MSTPMPKLWSLNTIFTKRNEGFFTKRYQSFLEEGAIPEMWPEMYKMHMGHLVLPVSKEDIKD